MTNLRDAINEYDERDLDGAELECGFFTHEATGALGYLDDEATPEEFIDVCPHDPIFIMFMHPASGACVEVPVCDLHLEGAREHADCDDEEEL